MRVQHDVRIEAEQSVARRVDLGTTDVRRGVQYLSLQIRDVDEIKLDEADGADASGGEVERDGRAQSACTNQQHACGLEAELTVDTHLRQGEMPAVARQFVGRERGCITAAGGACWQHEDLPIGDG